MIIECVLELKGIATDVCVPVSHLPSSIVQAAEDISASGFIGNIPVFMFPVTIYWLNFCSHYNCAMLLSKSCA